MGALIAGVGEKPLNEDALRVGIIDIENEVAAHGEIA